MTETVVVTGAGGGLGAAVAGAWGRADARLILGGRDQESLEAVAATVESAGGTGTVVRADARDEFDLERLMETAAREAGPIDVLVPAAAEAHDPDGEQVVSGVSYSAFDDVLRTTLRGSFAAIRESIPHLAADGVILVPVAAAGESPSRPAAVAAAGKRGLIDVATRDLDQPVVGVAHGVRVKRTGDTATLDRVAEAIIAAHADAARLDGRTVDVEQVLGGRRKDAEEGFDGRTSDAEAEFEDRTVDDEAGLDAG